MASFYDPLAGLVPGTTGQVDPGAVGAAGDAGYASGTGTGQHGITPHIAGGSGGMISSTFLTFWSWLKRPITTPLSPVGIFTAIGVFLLSVLAWNMILYHVRIAAEEI